MVKRFLWAGAVAALAMSMIAGSSTATAEKSDATQVLRYAVSGEPPSLDPGLATDTTSNLIISNIMAPLVKLGPSPALKPIPHAAARWRVRGATVDIFLRRSVRWTNGRPVTAGEYVWAWLRTISPDLAADYAYQFFGIKGAEAYNECDAKKGQNCAALRSRVGIKAIGPYRIRITLTSPQPWFIQQMSHHTFLPIYRPALRRYGKKWTEPGNIVTNGAFRLAAWRHDASITLVKNPRYFQAKRVKLQRVEMQIITSQTTAANAFDAGNVDVNDNCCPTAEIPKWKATPYFKVFQALATYYYGFNVKNIPAVAQRRAMAYAIDRQEIVENITRSGQKPARGFTPSNIAGGPTITRQSTMPRTANLTRAQQLMGQVSSPKKNITLFFNNLSSHRNIAVAVQSQWRRLGLDVSLKAMEWGQYLEFLGPPPNNDVDVYRLGWVYDFPDAFNGLVLFTCDSGNNNTNWCNRRYDALVKRAERTPNFKKRIDLYRQAENLITGPNGDVPLTPIYWYVFTALVRQNVKGFAISATHQIDLSKVSIR